MGPRVVLDGNYKLIVNERGNETIRELYDLLTDPAESNNLIDEQPQVADRLDRQLKNWQRSVLTSLTGADYR